MDILTKEKSKILIVHNYYQIPGGEDTVVANEKKLLENHGHEVVLYTRNNSEMKKMSKLQKIFLPFTAIFSLRTYKEVKKIINKHNIDIVHVHNTLNLISPSVYYAAFRCNIPVIQTIHNFRFLCPAATFYRNGHICQDCINNGLKCAIKHKCYRQSFTQTLASVVILKVHRMLGTYKKLNYICLTEFNKQEFLKLNIKRHLINPDCIYVKPNFVDINSATIPFEKRKNQFIFAGRLDKLKGIDLLLKSWIRIKNSDLIVCGTGPMEEWCKQFIQQNKLSNVIMMGFVPNKEVINMIAESKALILPTQWYECFPMTVVESIACGTPVIASDIGNTGSLIKNGVTGVKFESNSAEKLRNAVISLQDIHFKCREYYVSHYTEKINYNLMMKIYKECTD